MDINILTIVGIGLLIVVFLVNRKSKEKKESEGLFEQESEDFPYNLKNSVLTDREYKFYKILKPIADSHKLIIVTKIRLADFIFCKKNAENYQSWFNKINSKHVDFLLCNEWLRPVLAIELDDSSHDKPSRVNRDKFVNGVYKSVKLDILHIKKYNAETLENQILSYIDKSKQNSPPSAL